MAYFSTEGMSDTYTSISEEVLGTSGMFPSMDGDGSDPQTIAPYLHGDNALEPEVFRNLAGFEDMHIAPPPMMSAAGPKGFDDSFSSSRQPSFAHQEFPSSPTLVGASKAKVNGFDDDLFSWGGVASNAAEPKLAPAWVDPNLSFTAANTTATQVLADLEKFLSSQNIDFTCKTKKFKIDAVVYDGVLPSRFQVRVYKQHSAGAAPLVEFNKRADCALAFRQIFCRAAAQLSGAPGANTTAAPAPAAGIPSLSLPPMDDLEPVPVDVAAIVSSLVGTIRDDFADQQKQAVASLVNLSCQSPDVVQQHPGMVELLLQLLHSPDEDVVRCAAMIFAKVAVFYGEAHAERLLGPLFQVLVTPGTLVNMDTKRHVSAAVAELAVYFADSRPFPEEFTSTLVRFRDAADGAVRDNILRAEKALHQSCALAAM